ncbi:FAD-dependent oxidoreductase [Lamprobacter modestohalophilus]|uniref:NAD(P)/FAD-dependent oxidoreductase n=1 Tax=Lamprobacter modestohalophilus TaxID=1064514 RepID=UPI002ADEC494|nr:FAD-dependent oxidoreductase [Lamprobacter modestohalophilus]MEA1053520.1 FAD-dependent oxidoreductase [Lamprobacter modestohalophilus]
MNQSVDYLIIGAGIIGLTVARALQQRDPGARLTLIDKEPRLGQHASGRNSGVLHSGIYDSAESLKARFTRDGNAAWQAYCTERGLPLERCGKLIVARDAKEHARLATLEQRGRVNGVEVQCLDETETRALEPRARTFGHALFVPSTASVDPMQLLAAQQADVIAAGATLLCNHPYRAHLGDNRIQAGSERLQAGTVINCAGIYADRIAHDVGFGQADSLLPFKGLYRYADPGTEPPRTHLYPVPDLRQPFLGVHFTRTLDGRTKIGPTALPALWREHSAGLSRFRFSELLEIARRELFMFATNRNDFRALARQARRKQRRSYRVAEAATLLHGAEAMGFHHQRGRPGIRAQLVERKTNRLVMDFVIKGDAKSVHVLNAVSPTLTCARGFCRDRAPRDRPAAGS